jgi:Tol biopolymer transport system component
MPSLSPDNMELFFVSDRKGGYGGYDIWYSKFEDGLWRLPVNAGPGINTPGNEVAPFIAPDNKTLFFASDYWPGMGGSDLFVARRQKNGKWGRAENMGYPINTAC